MPVKYFWKLLVPWRERLVDVMEGLGSLEGGGSGAVLQQLCLLWSTRDEPGERYN